MTVKTIYTKNAPEPIGPYSQAKLVDGTLYVSGQIGLDPTTGKLAGDDVAAQAKQVMINLAAILKAAGKSFDDVVKTTCLLTDMSTFTTFNDIYAQYASSKPARSTFAVTALPANAQVEVELVAD